MLKIAFLKLENIHKYDINFLLLRNIVLKLFDNKCKVKACEILTQQWIDIQEVAFFMRQLCPFLKDKM